MNKKALNLSSLPDEALLTTNEDFEIILEMFDDLEGEVRNYYGDETHTIIKAYFFARDNLPRKLRADGSYPLQHAARAFMNGMRSYNIDSTLGAAVLLHDTVEDNPDVSFDMIEERFGIDVRVLVDGMTGFGKNDGNEFQRNYVESACRTLEKIQEYASLDHHVARGKGLDILDNLGEQTGVPAYVLWRKSCVGIALSHMIHRADLRHDLQTAATAAVEPFRKFAAMKGMLEGMLDRYHKKGFREWTSTPYQVALQLYKLEPEQQLHQARELFATRTFTISPELP